MSDSTKGDVRFVGATGMDDRIENGLRRLDAAIAKDGAAAVIAGGPNIAPTGDFVLVKRVLQEKSDGGIVLPESARDKMMAQVVEVGPGRITEAGVRIEPRVVSGQYVLINGTASAYPIDREHWMIREQEIVGVWRTGPRDS